jgi:hypothetical protein
VNVAIALSTIFGGTDKPGPRAKSTETNRGSRRGWVTDILVKNSYLNTRTFHHSLVIVQRSSIKRIFSLLITDPINKTLAAAPRRVTGNFWEIVIFGFWLCYRWPGYALAVLEKFLVLVKFGNFSLKDVAVSVVEALENVNVIDFREKSYRGSLAKLGSFDIPLDRITDYLLYPLLKQISQIKPFFKKDGIKVATEVVFCAKQVASHASIDRKFKGCICSLATAVETKLAFHGKPLDELFPNFLADAPLNHVTTTGFMTQINRAVGIRR